MKIIHDNCFGAAAGKMQSDLASNSLPGTRDQANTPAQTQYLLIHTFHFQFDFAVLDEKIPA